MPEAKARAGASPAEPETAFLRVAGCRHRVDEPWIMGIVNATPDSFSDLGSGTVAERVASAVGHVADGARVIDIGGQSGITGVPEITPAEEIGRVAPVLAGFVAATRSTGRAPLVSIDTYKPAVVSAVLEAGADLINDVSGLLYPEVAEQCASAGAGLVIMHNRSRPKQRLTDPFLYDDVVDDVVAFLTERMQQAVDLGVDEESVVLDPGPDFAKTPAQTVEVLRHLDRVMALGRPVLLALSRKDFIGALTLRGPRDRLAGTLAAIGAAIEHRSVILRVHDVADVADFLRVHRVLTGDEQVDPGLTLPVELRRHRRS